MSERENTDILPLSETSERAKSDTTVPGVSNSSAMWNRAGLLFMALCLIKLVMLFGLRKHLFEIHWRVALEPVIWVNHVAFYVFAVLAGLNLWAFAVRCDRGGVRVVRGANV